jgi:hypothetical protein
VYVPQVAILMPGVLIILSDHTNLYKGKFVKSLEIVEMLGFFGSETVVLGTQRKEERHHDLQVWLLSFV